MSCFTPGTVQKCSVPLYFLINKTSKTLYFLSRPHCKRVSDRSRLIANVFWEGATFTRQLMWPVSNGILGHTVVAVRMFMCHVTRALRLDIRKHRPRSALRLESEKREIRGNHRKSPGFLPAHLSLLSHRSPAKSTGRVVPARGIRSRQWITWEIRSIPRKAYQELRTYAAVSQEFRLDHVVYTKNSYIILKSIVLPNFSKTLPITKLGWGWDATLPRILFVSPLGHAVIRARWLGLLRVSLTWVFEIKTYNLVKEKKKSPHNT